MKHNDHRCFTFPSLFPHVLRAAFAIVAINGSGSTLAEVGGADSTVVYASKAGASLNSDLFRGGGTDDTGVLQGLLDRAKSGVRLHLVVDGPALVAGLDVHSNTTIECTAGGGFYLRDNTARAILRNANRSRDAVTDKYIKVIGCRFNGNRNNQTTVGPTHSVFRVSQEPDGTFRSGLQFLGVHYLTLHGLVLDDIYSWGLWVSNAKFIDVNNVIVQRQFTPYPQQGNVDQIRSWFVENGFGTEKWGGADDGMHFNGPIHSLSIDGAKISTWDDAISLTANDWVDDLTISNQLGPYVGQGPITDVTISNVTFMGCHHGIRLLSSSQRLDRVVIQNVTGTVRERMAVVSPTWIREKRGNFGSIYFNNINVELESFPPWAELFPERGIDKELDEYYRTLAAGKQPTVDVGEEAEIPLISVNGRIENLNLHNIAAKVHDDGRPIIRVGHDAKIDLMSVQMSIHDLSGKSVPLKLMGRIERLSIMLNWTGKEPIETKGGSIGHLRWHEGHGGPVR